MRTYVCDQETDLKNFTDNCDPQLSFVFSRLLKQKDIRVNGVKADKNVRLSVGDEVSYYSTPQMESKPYFSTVYEDENVLVADKFSGVNSEALYFQLALKNPDVRFIHRLDRNTEGLIVFAKNGTSEAELIAAFAERRVKKTYRTVCLHPFAKKHAVLEAYLKKDEKKSLVFISDTPVRGSQKILTEYTVLRQNRQFAELAVILHTGRTHQIRAHLAHVHHPVLGDEKYGDSAQNAKSGIKRQALLSYQLELDCKKSLSYLNGRVFTSTLALPDIFI